MRLRQLFPTAPVSVSGSGSESTVPLVVLVLLISLYCKLIRVDFRTWADSKLGQTE